MSERDCALPLSLRAPPASLPLQMTGEKTLQNMASKREDLDLGIPMLNLKTVQTSETTLAQGFLAAPTVSEQGSVATWDKRPPEQEAVACGRGKVGAPPQPLHLQIHVRCLRGLKDKVPRGSYLLRASLLERLGGHALGGSEAKQLETCTGALQHGGNFYDVGLYFEETLLLALPSTKILAPGLAFLFELCLHPQRPACSQRVLAWAAFPVCDSNLDVAEGRFKCPLLRGPYDQKFDRFQAIEDVMGLDLDLWLGNLYFQVQKLSPRFDLQGTPRAQTQDPSEVPVSSVSLAEMGSDMETAAAASGRDAERQSHISHEEDSEPAIGRQQIMGREAELEQQPKLSSKAGVRARREQLRGGISTSRTSPSKPGHMFTYKTLTACLGQSLRCKVLIRPNRSSGSFVCSEICFLFAFSAVLLGACKVGTMGNPVVTVRLTPGDPVDTSRRRRQEEELNKDFEDEVEGRPEGQPPALSYLEELEKHRVSVCCSPGARNSGSGEFFKHVRFALASLSWELGLAEWRTQGFWYLLLLAAAAWFLRLYLHYLSQWLLLWAIEAPVTKLQVSPHTVKLCYPPAAVSPGQELMLVAGGPLALNAAVLSGVLLRHGCRRFFAPRPDALSKFLVTMALWTLLDPWAVLVVDAVLGRLTPSKDSPTADVAKLYWAFVRTEQPGVHGVLVTVLVYSLLLLLSSLILYLYCLRWHTDSWISDAFQRTHSEEAKFFMPYDLEISNQELSRIVKRAEQWRGVLGERRTVSVVTQQRGHPMVCPPSCETTDRRPRIDYNILSPGEHQTPLGKEAAQFRVHPTPPLPCPPQASAYSSGLRAQHLSRAPGELLPCVPTALPNAHSHSGVLPASAKREGSLVSDDAVE
ncbi:uncharacterized protein LOC125995956 [Suncus etruscus]|uniref:uncharacterized protein LOC125995956 n=1 Tax=Suncus etruscus TaxID=109475 RepID=UPI002110103D|nr:uncharacterized protein LOC125995956 [Suncus etruscus]